MSFMWRKKPQPAPAVPEPVTAPAQPQRPKHKISNHSGWRRKITSGLVANGTLDRIVDELIWRIKGDGDTYLGKANNVHLTELMRIRAREIALLDHRRTMKVMIALGQQRAKNDAAKRRYAA